MITGAARAATPPATPDDVFAPGALHEIEVRVPAARWPLMEPGAGRKALQKAGPELADEVVLRDGIVTDAFAYVRGEVVFDGVKIADVGVRYKGHLSYAASRTAIRRPMKLDFERFVPGQRLAGLAELNLNNHAVDPSQAREALAFELFRGIGVPASRTGFALVWLSVPGTYQREFLGLYTLIEEVDKRFLKSRFGTGKGLLCKPGGMRGLAYLGEEWSAYEKKLRPKDAVEPALGARVIELARLTNRATDAEFAKGVGALLDVDEFLGYVAGNAALCNFDSFLATGHNYYLYVSPHDRRIRFVPWDMNMTCGGYSFVGTDEQIADTRVWHPSADPNRLIDRVLAVPAYRRAYAEKLRQLVEGPMSAERVRATLATVARHVRRAGEAATAAGRAGSPTTRPAAYERVYPPDLAWFVERREASMRAQLAGTAAGYVPGYWNPQRVPRGWEGVVAPARAILLALDENGDERIDEREFGAAVARALAAANVPPGGAADAVAVERAIGSRLPTPRKDSAESRAWAAWVVSRADANRDGYVTAEELTAWFAKVRVAADRDYDDAIAGRELVETLAGMRCPQRPEK